MVFCCSTLNLVGIITAVIAIIITYYKWTFKYWEKKGVVTPPPTIFFGNTLDTIFKGVDFSNFWKNFYFFFRKQSLNYGGIYFFSSKIFVPIEPELIKNILQKDFDHFVNHLNYINEKNDPLSGHLFALKDVKWRNLRVKLTPTFTSGKMKMMFDTLVNCSHSLKDVLDKSAADQSPVDIKDVLGCFTTDIIGSCAFGIECNALKNPNCEFRKYGKMTFENDFLQRMNQMLQVILPYKILDLIKYRVTKKSVEDFFMKMTKDTVSYREKNNIYRKDFMHLMIQLKNMGKLTDDEKLMDDSSEERKGLTIEEVAAQAFVFFLAGFETSSTTMTFALYEIALNQQIQTKLRDEISTVLKKYDGKITYDAVMELHYMDKVLNETLRKYPPVPTITRICNKQYKVPNTDIVIEKDTLVVIPTLGIHHDHEYYPNPTVFDPERFSEEGKASRPPCTWLPFGEGPRICIGLRFGLMQAKVGLVTLLQNYEIVMSRRTSVPIVFDKNNFILSAEGGVYLNVKKLGQ